MATAAEKAREKAARMAARRQSEPVVEESPSSPVLVGARSKSMVRLTVDLTPQMHGDLEDWARAAARSSGRTRITRVDVVRELVRQLLADEDLAERVSGRLTSDN